jgi:hypothetical protein
MTIRMTGLVVGVLVVGAVHADDRLVLQSGKSIDCHVLAFANGVFVCETKDGITNKVASYSVRQILFDAPALDEPQAGKPEGGQGRLLNEDVEVVALVDDGCEIYINGESIALAPGKAMTVQVSEGDILAVKAWDMQGGTACGFALAMTRKNGRALMTDTQWLSSNKTELGWNTKEFSDKTWKRASKVTLKWLDDAVRGQFKGTRKPVCIWGQGGNVYLRKTITFADFK